MLKKMRKRAQNKKGFTLVELIVVVVIILILAAVLVPSLLKYVEKANKANCKADAATLLSQLQADYAAGLASDVTDETAVTGDYTISGVTIKKETGGNVTPGEKAAVYKTSATGKEEEITVFAYNNGKYTATWYATEVTGTSGHGAGWVVKKNGD